MGFVDRSYEIKVLVPANPRQEGTQRWRAFEALRTFDGKPVGSFYSADLDMSVKQRRGALRSSWRAGFVAMIDPSTGAVREPPSGPDEDQDTQDGETEEITDAEDVAFELERNLQQALRRNLGQLEPGLVELDGGREQSNGAGRTDILARSDSGQTVVIELKAGEANHKAVAQLLAYIGAMMDEGHTEIRGLLIASSFTDRARHAARAAPIVKLKAYRYRFAFEDA